jgi:ribosomal protein S18 acetylase RimI-like enzyme
VELSTEKFEEIITNEKYSLNFDSENLFQLRKLETRLYDFITFEINESVPADVREYAGNKLFQFCKQNSIVISTDDMDYDIPIVCFLKDSGFKIKYIKVIYVKELMDHHFQYEDIFVYKTLDEIGLGSFMRVFEKTSDVGIEKDVSTYEFFSMIYDYAGNKYNAENYMVVINKNKEIGVMMPQVFPHNVKEGTIFHLGVVPEERNKGFGKIMHSKCLQILKNHGVEKYIGSTNSGNKPMRRIFESNECSLWFKREFYYAGV